jgi:hypothetical protein
VNSASNHAVEVINPTAKDLGMGVPQRLIRLDGLARSVSCDRPSRVNAVWRRYAIAEAKQQFDSTFFADPRNIRFSRQRPFATEIFVRSRMMGMSDDGMHIIGGRRTVEGAKRSHECPNGAHDE